MLNTHPILKTHAPNVRAFTVIKETLLKLKSHHHTIIVRDFNTPLLTINRLSWKQSQQRIMKLTGGPNRYLLEHFTPVRNNVPYSQHLMESFSKTDNILSHKASLCQQKEDWNNPLYHIRSPWIKAGLQQEKKQQTAYKLMETEQLSPRWPVGQEEVKKTLKSS